jgi:uncharacterized membrane-anchored protein YhcB (DUF1043 family)
MDNTILLGLAIVIFGVGVMAGWLLRRSRQRMLQHELKQAQTALQQSRNEAQQREEALLRSQQELQRSREELRQQQEEIQRGQQDLLRTQEEARQYRTHVMQHFTQTADLLQTLTLNYRAVYEHLAAGAAVLCDGQVKTLTPEALRDRLLAPPSEEPASEEEEVIVSQPGDTVSDAEQHPVASSQDPHVNKIVA